MSDAIPRRRFLLTGCRAALAGMIFPITLRSLAQASSRESTGSGRLDALVAELQKQIPQSMVETNVPGLSIALVKNARIVWCRGFGVMDGASKVPVDDHTVFQAQSMSKPVFAYAVLKLCERGVLNLDTPLTKYIPDRFLEGDPRLDLITARHVLSHTSGFQDWRSEKEPLKIHFIPGEKWLYSGEGYSYLQSVVTHLTGHVDESSCSRFEAGVKVCASNIDAWMKAHLLRPFGMPSSGYLWNRSFEKHMARGHDPQGKPMPHKPPTAADVARYGSSGALLTTPTDYARFLVEVINPKPSDAFRLSKASLDEMLRPQVEVEHTDDYTISWGLGWRIARTKNGTFISHGGDNRGFHSIAEASVEKKSGYVIMTNGENGYKVINKLAPSVSQRLYGAPQRNSE